MSRIVSTPAEIGGAATRFVEQTSAYRDRLVPILLPGLDEYFGPLLPMELCVVLGWTSNGKSTFMREWARRLSVYAVQRGMASTDGGPGGVIAWADSETPLEHLALSSLAYEAGTSPLKMIYMNKQPTEGLSRAAVRIARRPIYVFTSRASGTQFEDVTLTNILRDMLLLKSGKIDGNEHPIIAAYLDWLQSFPIDPTRKRRGDDSRRLQVSADVDETRSMGGRLSTPVILGVQSKQEEAPKGAATRSNADGGAKPIFLPSLYSGQETANIAQRSDRVLSVTSPARSNYPVGSQINYGKQLFTVTPGLVFVQVLKQRLEGLPAGGVFVYDYNPDEPDVMKKYTLVWADTQGFVAPWVATTHSDKGLPF